jgi:hypothetical protein
MYFHFSIHGTHIPKDIKISARVTVNPNLPFHHGYWKTLTGRTIFNFELTENNLVNMADVTAAIFYK